MPNVLQSIKTEMEALIMADLLIREEKPEDFRAAEHMIQRAFWNIHCPGCTEHALVRLIRQSEDYLPRFSRVAELDGRIVGAIYYTKARLVNEKGSLDIVTFGPLAVEPTVQSVGVGRQLLEETLALVREAGYPAVCIYGEPEYYPKRGFRSCRDYGITDPEGRQFDALMVYPLDESADLHGKLYESSVFERCDDPALLAKLEAELPAYPKIKIQEGFLQIFDCRFARVVEAEGEKLTLAYWELTLNAQAAPGVCPKPGDIVLFRPGNPCLVTRVCHNLL